MLNMEEAWPQGSGPFVGLHSDLRAEGSLDVPPTAQTLTLLLFRTRQTLITVGVRHQQPLGGDYPYAF